MRLRARLMLAFLVLAVIPLTALVTYSYASSRRAFRRAVEDEARTQADAMNQRLAVVRGALDEGLGEAARAALADQAIEAGLPMDDSRRAVLLESLRQAMGAAAPLVQAFEWLPAAAQCDPPRDVTAPEVAGGEAPTAPAPPEPAPLVLVLADPSPRAADQPPAGRDEGAAGARSRPDRAEIRETVRHVMAQAEVVRQEAAQRVEELSAQRQEVRRWVQEAGAALQAISSEEMKADALKRLEEARRDATELLGRDFSRAVERDGRVVGHLRVQVPARQLLHGVLAAARRDEGEIPFAVDQQGNLYTVDPTDEQALAGLPLTGEGTTDTSGQWVLSRRKDAASGVTFGIARPVGEGLAEIRRSAVRNLGIGIAFIGLAALGIVPVSRRMTGSLITLTGAASALAEGDLGVRVPVRSSDEIGRLAATFNHMAGEIQRHQHQQVQHRLLEAENERKSRELEEARRFQLALLPTRLPEHPEVEVAVAMRTATEVGGDYYDFRVAEDGALVAAVGDATGHGATAGTMVTMIKGLFTVSTDSEPQRFLEQAAGAIRSMGLGRMNMALSLLRIHRGRMTLSAAGMPPLLLHRRATGEVEEVLVEGMPLGGLAGAAYRQAEVRLVPGDTALLMSDGFPELLDADGEPLGYERAHGLFAEAVATCPDPAAIVAHLEAAAARWRGGDAPNDDVTFVVLRARPTPP